MGTVYIQAMMLGLAALLVVGCETIIKVQYERSSIGLNPGEETVTIKIYREKTERKDPKSPFIELLLKQLSEVALHALTNRLNQIVLEFKEAEYGTNGVVQHFWDPDIVTKPQAPLNVKGFDVVRDVVLPQGERAAMIARFQLEYKEESNEMRVNHLDTVLNYSKLRILGSKPKPVMLTFDVDLFAVDKQGEKVDAQKILSKRFRTKQPFSEAYTEEDELKEFGEINLGSSRKSSNWVKLPSRPLGYLDEFGTIYDSGYLGVNVKVTEGSDF